MLNTITIALSKGRILDETLPLLASAQIFPIEDIASSRKLVFATNHAHIKLLVIRATDVPTYVEFGAADIGISGKDVLMEHGGHGMYEPVDLEIARCKLMVAGPKEGSPPQGRLKVASKFVKTTQAYYAQQGIQVDIIKLYGAMELAPIMGLSDRIVDVVDTGATLKANGLEPLEHIADISARLIVSKASMKMKYAQIQPIVEQIKLGVTARRSAAKETL